MKKLTEEQVQEMNVIGATDFVTIFQMGELDGPEEEYATLSKDEEGTWIFYFMNRMECFDSKSDAVQFAKRMGCEIEEEVAEKPVRSKSRKMNPYERTRGAVYATGNRWAIENFNATH